MNYLVLTEKKSSGKSLSGWAGEVISLCNKLFKGASIVKDARTALTHAFELKSGMSAETTEVARQLEQDFKDLLKIHERIADHTKDLKSTERKKGAGN